MRKDNVHGKWITVRLVSDVMMKALGEGMTKKNARRVVSVSRHVIYGRCVVPTLDLPVREWGDGRA